MLDTHRKGYLTVDDLKRFFSECSPGLAFLERLDFEDISRANMAEVLKNFAKYLGKTIRTLGFLNRAAFEEVSLGLFED